MCYTKLHSIILVSGIPSGNGEIGDYVYLKNYTFIKNEATLFGGALAASTVVILASREKIKALDIRDWYVHTHPMKGVPSYSCHHSTSFYPHACLICVPYSALS